MPSHPLPPDVAFLASPDAEKLLRAAVLGDADDQREFTATRDDFHYRPGAEATGIYTVEYVADGTEVIDHLLISTADVGAPAVEVSTEHGRFSVWRHPADPRLPALAAACDPGTVLSWLAQLGPHREGINALDITLLAYRPLRRAVLRLTADGHTWFVKVMSDKKASVLAERIESVAAAGLTEPIALRPAPGVLLTAEVSGVSLAQRLVDWQILGHALPNPAELVALLDRLPVEELDLPRRESWADRLDFHSATAAHELPDHADRIASLAARLEALLDSLPAGPIVPVHGDFYEANIFVSEHGLQIIDVDSSGPGHRVDDLACCLAHLAVLPSLAPESYPRIDEVLADWLADFDRRVDPASLRARAAAVLVSLVSGAGPLAETWLELAELWADSAVSAHGKLARRA